MSNLGERLKEERKRLKITQEKLAEAGGVTKRMVIYYEQNKISPPVEFLNKISENITDIDIAYIYAGTKKAIFNQIANDELSIQVMDDMLDLSMDEIKLLLAYRHTSLEQKAMFDALASSIGEPKKTR
jgi:transcriptional regulator with XRE-family HTH domain